MPKIIPKTPPLKAATVDEFEEALVKGNASALASVLGRMESLGPSECQLLADHFDSKSLIAKMYPFRLEFVRRRVGRPAADFLRKTHDDLKIKNAYPAAHAKFGKYEATVKGVMDKTGLKRTRVTSVLSAQKSK